MRRGRKGKKKMNELTKSKVRLECEWIEMIPRHGPFTSSSSSSPGCFTLLLNPPTVSAKFQPFRRRRACRFFRSHGQSLCSVAQYG
jgi:hypothetical protein